jgi:hypothetical protein
MQIREEISIFSNGGHLGYKTALTDTILKGTHLGTIPSRFGLIWFSGFRGEDLNLNQVTLNLVGMVLGWVPFKIVSDSPTFHSRWLLLLKIEISSIVHCCFSINEYMLNYSLPCSCS